MCRFMKNIDAEFSFLSFERRERIKSTTCETVCGGVFIKGGAV